MANSKIEQAVAKKKFSPLQKMAEGRDATLRLEAIEAMGKVDCEDSFNFLTGYLRSPDASVRGAAAAGLGHLKMPKARAFLEHQLAVETDEGAKKRLHEALATVRDPH